MNTDIHSSYMHFTDQLLVLARLLFPTLVLTALLTNRPRHFLLFLWSVTFQTNLIGWLSLWPEWLSPRVRGFCQAAGVYYLATVAVVWFVALGGKETDWVEWLFNVAIHYVTFVIVLVRTNQAPAPWPARWTMLIYPVFYWLQMSTMDSFAGWRVYPFGSMGLLLIGFVFVSILYFVNPPL